MKPVNVGICGLGTVGGGSAQILLDNKNAISARTGCEINVVQVAAMTKPDHPVFDHAAFTTDIFEVARNPEIDILVELIGGYEVAKALVLEAIAHGKHIVTANKALIAVHGTEIFKAAAENNVVVAYEAAVAGGIPIIKAIREGLAANEIELIAGIINGTGNFILTEMQQKGRDFADVLSEAQTLGYAEADPTFDVEGIDAAHKLTIMASTAFGVPLQFNEAYTEGISKLTTQDVEYAGELGYRIKHLGIAKKHDQGFELRVHPTLVPKDQMISNVDGVMNAVLVNGNAVGETLYYGAGAGAMATGSAVVADIIDIARLLDKDMVNIPYLGFMPKMQSEGKVIPINQIKSAFYLRMQAQDHPGVLAKVASIFSEQGINIESVMQKEREKKGDLIPLILLTHEVEESCIDKAIAQVEALDIIDGHIVKIRVEHFGR